MVRVITSSEEELPITFEPTDTLEDLKLKIASKTAVEAESQSLYCHGFLLHDGKAKVRDFEIAMRELPHLEATFVVVFPFVAWPSDLTKEELDTDLQTFAVWEEAGKIVSTLAMPGEELEVFDMKDKCKMPKKQRFCIVHREKNVATRQSKAHILDSYDVDLERCSPVLLPGIHRRLVNPDDRSELPRSVRRFEARQNQDMIVTFKEFARFLQETLLLDEAMTTLSPATLDVMTAVEENDATFLANLPKTYNVNSARTETGLTPLMLAAERGYINVVRLLVEKGSDVNARDNNGRSALIRASLNGKAAIVRYLLEMGCEVDGDKDGSTALIWTCRSADEHEDVVELLTKFKANVDALDNLGWTPLMFASQHGHFEIVKFLVEHGSSVSTKDKDGWTALAWASRNGHLKIVKFLIENGADLKGQMSDGWTPLMWAVFYGHLEVAKHLVDNGCDVDAAGKDGWTPLMWAIYHGNLEVTTFLVNEGCNVDFVSNDGSSAETLARDQAREHNRRDFDAILTEAKTKRRKKRSKKKRAK